MAKRPKKKRRLVKVKEWSRVGWIRQYRDGSRGSYVYDNEEDSTDGAYEHSFTAIKVKLVEVKL